MRNAFALALSLSLLATSSAIAHDTLPAQWCPVGSKITIVGTFDLTPVELATYWAQHLDDGQVLGSGCNSPKTCGIVDDWFWANDAAFAACAGLQKNAQSPPAMPLVSYPGTFNLNVDTTGPDGTPNGVKDHHDLYMFRSGLKGTCVVCDPMTSTPTPSAPATAH